MNETVSGTDSVSPFLSGNFAPVRDEIDADSLPIAGDLPPGLRGTLYRNGPNPQFEPVPYYHWFTGDGMVHAITLQGDHASYRNRWVRTDRFRAEADAGRALFQGFGRPLAPEAGRLDTGVANTHVLMHAGRLLALEEAHPPTRLDPVTLATLGYDDFDGGLSGPFTAHPKRDPATGDLVFFSYSATGPLSAGMSWGVIAADGTVRQREFLEAPYCAMVHDFGVSAAHVVLPVLPLTGDLGRAMQGGPPFAWEPSRSGFLGVMRRDRGAASLAWVPFEARYAFHVMNAFDEDGDVVVDVVEYDAAPLFPLADGSPPSPEGARSRLARWRIDAAGRQPVRREVLDDSPGEFPRIDERRAGLPYRHAFRIGRDGETDAIIHLDLATRTRHVHAFPPEARPSEAVFVPRAPEADEGDGWLLTVVWDAGAGSSALVVLDATDVARPPVARVALPRRVPFGFHGSWVAA